VTGHLIDLEKDGTMAKWTTEKMLAELRAHLGDQLVSAVLYGSAAAGDHSGKRSDINLLVVVRELQVPQLRLLSKALVPWVKQGHSEPLLLAEGSLAEMTDVFPLEILDMQENHRPLYGPDPLQGLAVKTEDLRMELEHELRGKLMRLKARFALTEARPGLVEKLMVDSLSTFLVLLKGVLRLRGEKPPARKMEALRKLRERLDFDLEPFEALHRLKNGEKIVKLDVLGTFEKYLGALEAILHNVNE
jgi:hypothetical protein